MPLLGVVAYVKYHPQFGGKITTAHSRKYASSPHWNGKKFVNSLPVKMDVNLRTLPGLLREQFRKDAGREPSSPIPIAEFNLSAFEENGPSRFIWYGHAAFLARISGLTIAIDPMMGPDASPIGPIRTRRFSSDTIRFIDQWPEIDAVLFTHDHYDHIDYASVLKLMPKVKLWLVALGAGRHLERWGVPASDIIEMDWWDTYSLGDVEFTFTPTQHFAGRGPTDRGKSFWGGWAIRNPDESIYFTGDGGYGPHFKEVGNRLGPFDLCISESGQYNPLWHAIHMYPEESIQAAIDAKAGHVVPFHWAGFRLALHTWTDPVERFTKAADEKSIDYSTPRPGEIFTVKGGNRVRWWESLISE